MADENLMKFPSILREGFRNNKIDFFEATEWNYDPIYVYRMVLRDENDYSRVTRNDFASYAEKPRRGMERFVDRPDFYGVSVFTELAPLVNKLNLPKPGKKIALGHIKKEYGPIYKTLPHICLWLYKDADFLDNDFKVSDYDG